MLKLNQVIINLSDCSLSKLTYSICTTSMMKLGFPRHITFPLLLEYHCTNIIYILK